jgi:hypothetical protein
VIEAVPEAHLLEAPARVGSTDLGVDFARVERGELGILEDREAGEELGGLEHEADLAVPDAGQLVARAPGDDAAGDPVTAPQTSASAPSCVPTSAGTKKSDDRTSTTKASIAIAPSHPSGWPSAFTAIQAATVPVVHSQSDAASERTKRTRWWR